MKNKEVRGHQGLELREDGGEGKFAGYIAVWDTVDSYRSKFVRGCFKKTIEERGDRIKVLDDHGKIVGRVDEIREDDFGCYVEGSLTMGVERARDVFELIRSNAIDTLSFGFKTMKDKFVDGIRNITEVKLYEVSPVTFEANEAAQITAFRAEDFNETSTENELLRKGSELIDSLLETVYDIWWRNDDGDEVLAKLDTALEQFHAAYLSWAQTFISTFWTDEERSKPTCNEVASEFRSTLNGRSLEQVAADTSFTVTELRMLKRGELLPTASAAKLSELSEDLKRTHAEKRREKFEGVCRELRCNGLTHAEMKRLKALFEIRAKDEEDGLKEIMSTVQKLTM